MCGAKICFSDAMFIISLTCIAVGSSLSLRGGNSTTNLRSLDTVFKAEEKPELYVKIKLAPHSRHFLHVISAEIFAVFLTTCKTNE
jgi:hypothetical protein